MEDISFIKLNLINKNHIIFIFITLLTLYKESFQNYFDSFSVQDLNNTGNLVEIKDYLNQYLIISTDKSIYAGINPELKTITSAKIKDYSFGATYNESIILFSCLEDSLLSKVNMTSGEEEQILNYDVLTKVINRSDYSLSSCSLSIDNEIVYLAISYNENSSPTNYKNLIIKTNINYKQNETNKIETNSSIENFGNLNNENKNNSKNDSTLKNGTIDEDLLIYSFQDNIIKNTSCAPKISCETISNKLVCAIVADYYNNTYSIYGIIINDTFDNLANTPQKIYDFSSMPYFKLHKIDNTHGRLVMNSLTFDIKIIADGLNYKIDSSSRPSHIYAYSSYKNLFDYNNNHIFYISKGAGYMHFSIIKKGSSHSLNIEKLELPNKIMGYLNENNDKYIFIYQTSSSIKYFNIENLKTLFSIHTAFTEHKLISHQSISVNTTEIFNYTGTYKYEKLYLYSKTYYLSTLSYVSTFPENSYTFDYDNQQLNVSGSDNNWYSFTFAFKGNYSIYEIYFVFGSSPIYIKTCKFNCGWCTQFDYCYGCKVNFTQLIDATDDECLPIDQNVKYYIYNKTTGYFEKCYKSCLFCSLMDSYSSDLNHNCLTCKDGYTPSYIYQGNCYKINESIQNQKYPKIVESVRDENYTEVSSCYDISKIYKIEHTGECTSECPKTSKFYNFIFDKSVNLTNQSFTQLGLQYDSRPDIPPKLLYGNLCYQKCPQYSIQVDNEDTCKCNFTWTQNKTTKEIICNGGYNKCVDKNYKFLLTDTKECVQNNCPAPYYRYNYDCYLTCPNDFTYVNEEKKLCICKYPWYNNTQLNETVCVIGKSECTYENHKYLLYDTKECITKNCTDDYYRYNFICYKECPDYTTVDEENKMCKCKYAWHYDESKDIINCYNGKYKCINNNYKYLLYDTKECIKTNCPSKYYKFGYNCYTVCPNYTITDSVNMKCKCYHAWHQDIITGEINCYDEEKCINSEYNYFLIDTKECVKNNCPKNYYSFGYLCYKTCPRLTNANDLNKKCECIHSWHQDINTKEIICYENEDYCKENDYKFFVIDTKECVNNECPKNYYKYNLSCYLNCPDYTEADTNSKTCKCKYTWQQNTTDEITCNINKETCILAEYNYLLTDTKECIKNQCPTNYYLYNYKCYKNGCPINSEPYPDNKFECKKACPNGTYLVENTENCVQNCPNKYYFNEKRNIFSPCLSQCSKCDYYGNSVNSCIECDASLGYFSAVEKNYVKCYKCDGDSVKIDTIQNKCIINCDSKFYFNSSNLKVECLGEDESCPEKLPYQNLQYLDECLEVCSYEYQKEGLCKINKLTNKVVENTINDVKNVINDKNSSILEESSKGDGLIIEGNGLVMQIVTSDAMKNSKNEKVSSIDLNECESILKKHYKIDSILILKTDVKSDDLLTTSVQYELYHPTERYKLDTSLCGDTKITISVPVNLTTEIQDLYDSFSAQGYDIFNSEDDFYNDICSTYTSGNNTDILLSDRKADFYDENLTFCQEGCKYSSYNPDTKKVDCNCYVQTSINTSKILNENFENIISASFFDPMSNSNLKIFICYKLVFSWKGFKNNIGGILMIVIIVISIALGIIYYVIERKKVASILNDILDYKKKQYKINLSKKIILKKQKQNLKNSKKKLPIPDSNNYILATEGKNLKNTNDPPKRIFIKSVLKYDKKRKKKEIRLSTLNNDCDENIENMENSENINNSSISSNNVNNNVNNEYNGYNEYEYRNFYENMNKGVNDDVGYITSERKNIYDNTINHHQEINGNNEAININYIQETLNNVSNQNNNNIEENDGNSRIIRIKSIDEQSPKNQPTPNIKITQPEFTHTIPKQKLSGQLFPRQHSRQNAIFIQQENDIIIPQKKETSVTVGFENMPVIIHKKNKFTVNNNYLETKKITIMKTNTEKSQAQTNSNEKSQYSTSVKKIMSYKNLKKKFVIHKESELNGMDYEEAIIYDKRTFLKTYWSILKSKQLILFTFFNNGDYNLLTIKICLFLFSFSLSFAVNGLFFDDDSMHKLYENNGQYDFLYQIPQVVYSTLVSNTAQFLIEFLSLSADSILEIRSVEKIEEVTVKTKKKYKCIVIKFHLFFLLLFLFNFLFWYFISCFCAVYKNTQWALIKDTLVSFGLSLLYPFGTCIVSTLLRIISLKDKKKDKKCLFKISNLIS